MSDEHKAALARGRVEGKAVRDYLTNCLEEPPKRGRKPVVKTPEQINAKIAELRESMLDLAPYDKLKVVTEILELEKRLEADGLGEKERAEMHAAFVEHALAYAKRTGTSRAAFRAVGVSAEVLEEAGFTRKGNGW